jgi:eukaryotic-like serine/threonine-protein kinase
MPEPFDPATEPGPATRMDEGMHDSATGDSALDALPPMPSHQPPPPSLSSAPTDVGNQSPLQIPGYEILGQLGVGGMGIVYKARQVALNRVVALKMSRGGGLVNAEELARFKAEGEAVARLHHPNIIQIYEVGQWNGCPYFSLEYAEGGSLASILRGMPQQPRLAAEVVEALARAIHFAHQQGIIHRDLKPANVLLSGEGRAFASDQKTLQPSDHTPTVGPGPQSTLPQSGLPFCPKIADFGIAKRLYQTSMQTATGAVLGTAEYMAPEQAWGATKRRPIGPAADVYSLGAILYEMLTGRPPFLGETPLDTLQQVVSQDPVPPTRLAPRVPKDLETICLKCLQKEPQRRYESGAALADDLQRFLEYRPIVGQPAGAMTRLASWRRRNPLIAALVIAVFVLFAAGTAISSYFAVLFFESAKTAESKSALALKNAEESQANADEAAKNERKAKKFAEELKTQTTNLQAKTFELENQQRRAYQLLYEKQIMMAQMALGEKDVGRVLDLLDLCSPEKTGGADYRGFEWHYLRRRCGPKLNAIDTQAGPIVALAATPDGSMVAHAHAVPEKAGEPIEIWLWHVQMGFSVRLTELPRSVKAVNCLAFSRDGKRLAAACADGTVRLAEVPADLRQRYKSPRQREPDGSGHAKVPFNNVPQVDRLNAPHKGPVTCVLFTADGKYYVTGSVDTTIRFWDAETDLQVGQPLLATDGVEWLAERPPVQHLVAGQEAQPSRAADSAGQALAAGCRDGSILYWNKKQRIPYNGPKAHRAAVSHLEYNPNGKQLASADADGVVRLADYSDASADEKVGELPHQGKRVHWMAYSPDGAFLATVAEDGKTRLWNTATQALLGTYADHQGEAMSIVFLAKGKFLASGGRDGQLVLRAFSIQPEAAPLAGKLDSAVDLAWSGAGDILATSHVNKLPRKELTTTSEVIVWKVDSSHSFRQPLSSVAKDEIRRLAFRPGSAQLAVASNKGGLQIWDLDRKEDDPLALQPIGSKQWSYYGLAWGPGGQQLATTSELRKDGDSYSTSVNIWDAAAGNGGLGLKENPAQSFVDNQLPKASSIAWAPGGKWLALASNRASHVRLWDSGTRTAYTLSGHDGPVNGLAFSPDGRILASASSDRTVRLWDVENQKLLAVLQGHARAVLAVAFHPLGQRLASGSLDGTVKLWDVAALQDIFTITINDKAVNAVAFQGSPGYFLAAASDDGSVHVFNGTPVKDEKSLGRK